jgi:hypothetical protein
MAEAGTFAGALDDARNIGENEGGAIGKGDQAKIRGEGSEGVVGDFRLCATEDAKEGRLTDVREADEADVSQEFKFEDNLVLFAWQTGLSEAWDLSRRGSEVGVTPAAPATFAQNEGLRIGQIPHNIVGCRVSD